jgi:hypothetical protein
MRPTCNLRFAVHVHLLQVGEVRIDYIEILNGNAVPNLRLVVSSNANPANWHNIQNEPAVNSLILTNTRAWFRTYGVLP